MTRPITEVPLRQRPIVTRRTVVWTAMGTLSAGYLGVLLLAPDWLEDLRPAARTLDPQSSQGQRAAARLASDIGGLRDSVSKIQMDIAKIKTDVQGTQDRNKSIAIQMASLEQKIATGTEARIEANAPPPSSGPQPNPPRAQPAPELIHADAAAPPALTPPAAPPTGGPKILNAAPIPNVTTGQIVDPAGTAPAPVASTLTAADGIDFGTAVVKPAPKPLGVKLSSGASVDALRLSWSLLAESHSNELKSLQARYVASGDPQNPSYDLIAGPFKSSASAKKVCKSLAAKNIPCALGDFKGETL